MRKTANLSLLLLLGLSFCFTRCKDKDLEVDPPTVFNLQGNWECRDTTIWIGGESPEYNYRTLTFYDTTFEYIIEIEKEDPNDHSATISAIHTIKGVYSIYYPTIRFTPDLQEDYIGEVNAENNHSFYLLNKKWADDLKYTHALIFTRMKE